KIFTALSDKSGAEYWVPHIGLYNGMRLNEICQLNVEDVINQLIIDGAVINFSYKYRNSTL
ncbi:hypothetical protein, partial [Terasakiella brassicae]|uniref:hypothetical protein n=1 Tax=Terasakiella brassicae TaxID=1634917 RepID=UPI001E31D165